MNWNIDTNQIVFDKFLSECLNKGAYKFILNESLEQQNEDILKVLETKNIFLYCKAPFDDAASIKYLSEYNFKRVETQITLQKDIDRDACYTFACDIRLAIMKDELLVVELARDNFEYSRFHADPTILDADADTIKAEWVRNYFKGTRGDHMLVATIGGEIKGFLLLINELNIMTIDLIAVDKNARNKNVATDMINHAELNLSDSCKKYRVGTQLTNTSSLSLYQKLRFEIIDKQHVFHYHT